MEHAWAYGTAICNINDPYVAKEEGREVRQYTISEVKKMPQVEILNLISRSKGDKKEGSDEQLSLGASELARTLGMFLRDGRPNTRGVVDYVLCLCLEKETQSKIGRDGESRPIEA